MNKFSSNFLKCFWKKSSFQTILANWIIFFYEWEPTKIINCFSDFCSTIKWINQNEFHFSYIIHNVFWIVWWWQWSYIHDLDPFFSNKILSQTIIFFWTTNHFIFFYFSFLHSSFIQFIWFLFCFCFVLLT